MAKPARAAAASWGWSLGLAELGNIREGIHEKIIFSPKEPFKCEESEITETRDNYERCASNKIGEITAWVERKQRKRRRRRRSGGQNDDDSILTVCNAVRQLLYDCGNELGWCFTEDQVRI